MLTGMKRLFVLLAALAPLAAFGDEAVEGAPGVPLFVTPAFIEAQRPLRALLAAGRWREADRALDPLIAQFPEAPSLRFARANIAAFLGEAERAAATLGEAASLGMPGVEDALLRQPFAGLPNRAALEQAARRAPPPAPPHIPTPALIRDGFAAVEPGNSVWDAAAGAIRVAHVFPPRLRFAALAPDRNGPAWDRLRTLVARGYAAGSVGDLYDNRDHDHSTFGRREPGQLSFVRYGDAATAARVDYGVNTQILFDAPVLGNSSTAFGGPRWRSQARGALTRPGVPAILAAWYANDHVYVFPEHRDHDPPPDGRGDLLPANTPYMLISQGSSGSDLPLLAAVRMILAGLPTDAKTALRARRMLAPAVQQIFRRAMAPGDEAADYMSPAAHPAVFDGAKIELERVLDMAQAVTPDALPPLARLRVLEEPTRSGPLDAAGEVLFDTPHAAARLWRAASGVRRYVLDAGGSEDPHGRPLSLHWRVLRGDPEMIDIRPLNADGSRVEIEIRWHDPGAGAALPGGRIDIGLFAEAGGAPSAPAFFSLAVPVHEERRYDDEGRPLSIADFKYDYADPLLWPRRRWRDEYAYGPDGALLGWTRAYGDGATARFTAHGLKVTKTDPLGRPAEAAAIVYQSLPDGEGALLEERPTGRVYAYHYGSETDTVGIPVKIE